MKNLYKFYNLIEKEKDELGKFYNLLEEKNKNKKEDKKIIDKMLKISTLKYTPENKIAIIDRLVGLREDSLIQALKKEKKNDAQALKIKNDLFEETRIFHEKRQEQIILKAKKEGLLSEFYLTLLQGVHDIGKSINKWQPKWNNHIIEGINKELEKKFKSTKEVILYLEKNNLLEFEEKGKIADRAYSVLIRTKTGYKSQAYGEFFKKDVLEIISKINNLIDKLKKLQDEDFNQKQEYIKYFKAIKNAFKEKNKLNLINSWRKVDEKWMKISSSFQVGHPLEYYEDHYRKAVALEWDLRISDPRVLLEDELKNQMKNTFTIIFNKLSKNTLLQEKVLKNIDKTKLFIGRPALYYGSELNGLFSAQVVPNDEIVSQNYGKKIFAFTDNIRQSAMAKPFMKIHTIIYGQEFLDLEREILYKKPKIWKKIYEITTIGHEFGHILWMDEETEQKMNESGMFKNIEEFKATTGGLVNFFMNEDKKLRKIILRDIVKRAISLISWMKTPEVEPYYCEGLIHLSGLFDSGVLEFDKKLKINLNKTTYNNMKNWYEKTYNDLANHYLNKLDGNIFLSKFVKLEKNTFLPVNNEVKEFVKYYWNLHNKIGRIIDKTQDKSKWIKVN